MGPSAETLGWFCQMARRGALKLLQLKPRIAAESRWTDGAHCAKQPASANWHAQAFCSPVVVICDCSVSELMLCGLFPSPSIQASGEVLCREPRLQQLEIPAGLTYDGGYNAPSGCNGRQTERDQLQLVLCQTNSEDLEVTNSLHSNRDRLKGFACFC